MKIPRSSFKSFALSEISDAIDNVATLSEFDFDDSISSELSDVLSHLNLAFDILHSIKINPYE